MNGDMFDSTKKIGALQFQRSLQLLRSKDKEELTGSLSYRHSFVHMPSLNVSLSEGKVVRLCRAALGYSFAAGTTDGPGMFSFKQGETSGNSFWNFVRFFVSNPSKADKECHSPKPILLNTGGLKKPYDWQPSTVPLQLFRIGSFLLIAAPAEFTTMAGRRLRSAIKSLMERKHAASRRNPTDDVHVVIAGLANSYAGYVTTREEYSAQRYEGASTLYGQHTLDGYIQEYIRLTKDMVSGQESSSDDPPKDMSSLQISYLPSITTYELPEGIHYGDLVPGHDAHSILNISDDNNCNSNQKCYFRAGKDTIRVSYYSANPREGRSDQRQQISPTSFLCVQFKKVLDEKRSVRRRSRHDILHCTSTDWMVVADDGDWSTVIEWSQGLNDLSKSKSKHTYATVTWSVPEEARNGLYRICHEGVARNIALKSTDYIDFSGCSSDFEVRH